MNSKKFFSAIGFAACLVLIIAIGVILFAARPDNEAISRDISYGSDAASDESQSGISGEESASVIENDYNDNEPNEAVNTVPDSITFTGTIIDNTIESLTPVILVDVDENQPLSYDKVLFELTEEQKDWAAKVGERVRIVCSDMFEESLPPVGSLISIESLSISRSVSLLLFYLPKNKLLSLQ